MNYKVIANNFDLLNSFMRKVLTKERRLLRITEIIITNDIDNYEGKKNECLKQTKENVEKFHRLFSSLRISRLVLEYSKHIPYE
jgi:hypothetical protein